MHANPDRQAAHDLIDLLPAEKVAAVRGLLEVMVDPVARSLEAAARDDRELTPATTDRIEAARTSLADGEGIPHDEVRREFGLNP